MRTAIVLMALAVPQAAMAQQYETNVLLHGIYGLWGMMDGAAVFCWQVADYDIAYMEAHQIWLGRNLLVRDELDATLAALNEAPGFAVAAEAAGSNGILDILKGATNQEEACHNWLSKTNIGTYDAEVFMAELLGLLRERDGL